MRRRDLRGQMTHYVLFVISLVDRVVHVAGITTQPDEAWMLQVARNLTDEQSGALATKRYLIIDRDTKYSERFRKELDECGADVIRLPPMSPNLNAYSERTRSRIWPLRDRRKILEAGFDGMQQSRSTLLSF